MAFPGTGGAAEWESVGKLRAVTLTLPPRCGSLLLPMGEGLGDFQ